jgi:hypothetical protein
LKFSFAEIGEAEWHPLPRQFKPEDLKSLKVPRDSLEKGLKEASF